METIKPTIKIATSASRVFCVPILRSATGNKKVLIADAILLKDIARPTPVARISVGKLSAGKTPTRLLTADNVNVKIEKARIDRTAKELGNSARASKLMTKTIKELIKKPRREHLCVK